jgi:surface protein
LTFFIESGDIVLPEIPIIDIKKPKVNNWIDTIFRITDTRYDINLISLNNDLTINDIDVYIEGKLTPVKFNGASFDPQLKYHFNKTGVYNIKFNIKKKLTTMKWLFANNLNLVAVKFLPGFDSSEVTSMEKMFVSTNIQYLDMRYLDTRNVRNFEEFININNYYYNFKTPKIVNFPMIDLSSFDTSKATNCLGMLHELHKDIVIKISNKFTKCREQIPYFNKVINIDEEACHYIGNCKSCKGSHETLRCSKCVDGYRLMKNGFCSKIENYFTAVYDVKSTNKSVEIINLDGKDMTITDIDMFIDGRKVVPVLKYGSNYGKSRYFAAYNFKKVGKHNVKVYFKRTPSNFRNLFYLCFDLESIKFSRTFDTSKIQCMAYMFAKCTSLKSVDVSSFDTSSVGDFMAMFQGCTELKSLDLSNFNVTNGFIFQSMFDEMKNLQHLDISNFINPYYTNSMIINNSAKEATIVLNRKLRGFIFPSGWKRIYKDNNEIEL